MWPRYQVHPFGAWLNECPQLDVSHWENEEQSNGALGALAV